MSMSMPPKEGWRRLQPTVYATLWQIAVICLWGSQTVGLANPNGGLVVLGNATIDSTKPGITTITQGSSRAVINWGSFSIGVAEQTIFRQPNVSSATLNRVLGSAGSIVDGRLSANGHVFLINTNGILFGRSAVVDTAGLLASTLDTTNEAFMAGGDMVFQGNSQATVTNLGQINAASGDVFLIGLQVNNAGAIRAPNGTVGLAAGSDVLIWAAGDERVVVRNAVGAKKDVGVDNSGIIEANVAELKAHNGNVYALAIRNTGRVAATAVTKQGGRILLRANGGAIENAGELVARGTEGKGGDIQIHAGTTGSATISGKVDADGPTSDGGAVTITGGQVLVAPTAVITANGKTAGGFVSIGTAAVGTPLDTPAVTTTEINGSIRANGELGLGGIIHVGGDALTLATNAVVTANGTAGGGSIFAGGGFRGLDSLQTPSLDVKVESGAALIANATGKGNGGNVVVFAGRELTFNGTLQARGGQAGGDGGVAELSGKEQLRIQGLTDRVDLSSPNGRTGTLLIDPNDILITDIGGGTTVTSPAQANVLDVTDVSAFLNTANLIIETDSSASGGSGNITSDGLLSWSSNNSLTINAQRDFSMTSSLLTTGVIDSQGGGDVMINAGRAVVLDPGALITTTTGNVMINANQGMVATGGDFNGISIGGSIETMGGNITLTGRTGDGSTTQTAAILLDAGSLRADAGGVVTLASTGGKVVGNGPITAAGLRLSGADEFSIVGPGNSIDNVATIGTIGSLNLDNSVALTVGTVGADSGVSAAGDITLTLTGSNRLTIDQAVSSQGGALALNAYGIDINGAALSNTGTGTIHLAATRDIALSSGATITVENGLLQLDANQGLIAETGSFEGIRLSDASLTTRGSGAIVLNGLGGDTGDNNNGVALVLGSTIRSIATGALAGSITLNGVAGGGDNGNRGVTLQNSGTAISSAGGEIVINGTGSGTGLDNAGVDVGADAAIKGDGATTVETDGMNIDGAAQVTGTGTLTLKALTAGTSLGLGDGASGLWSLSTAGIAAISGFSSVTLGDNSAGDVDIQTVIWNAPVVINSSGAIIVNGQLTNMGGSVTLSGADATLNADITTDGHEIAINSTVTLGASARLDSTNAGNASNGAHITVTGAIAGGVGAPDLIINAGLAGDASLLGSVGGRGTLETVDITARSLLGSPLIEAATFRLTANGSMDLTHLNASTVSVTGRSGADTIAFASMPTRLTIDGAGDSDTVTFASALGPISTNVGNYAGIESLVGSSSGADTLVGASGDNTFLITTANGGSVAGMSFASFENLSGSNDGVNVFTFSQQATIDGLLDGGGGTSAKMSINDSNLSSAVNYSIGAAKVTAGSRQYQFQNVDTVSLRLGSGSDTVNTNFFAFTQSLQGGAGDNRLLIAGTAVANSPQASSGQGTITFSGFSVPALAPVVTSPPPSSPPPVIPPDVTQIISGSLLQNVIPMVGNTPPPVEPAPTNNSTAPPATTSTPAPAATSDGSGTAVPSPSPSATGDAPSSPPAGNPGDSTSLPTGNSVATPATSVTAGTTAPGQGPVSMGGGPPASPATQTQMAQTTSPSTESELSQTLGGDGTMGITGGEGLVSVDPNGTPPSASTTAGLNTGTGILAQSELAVGVGGLGEMPMDREQGAQSMVPGEAPPNAQVQQGMENTSNPESYSDLSEALGGDGTVPADNSAGSVPMSVDGATVPAETSADLAAQASPGAMGELSSALGGSGEVLVNPAGPAAAMDPAGEPASPQIKSDLESIVGATAESELSSALAGDGTAIVADRDGPLGIGMDGAQVSPGVLGQLTEATDPESAGELDQATR